MSHRRLNISLYYSVKLEAVLWWSFGFSCEQIDIVHNFVESLSSTDMLKQPCRWGTEAFRSAASKCWNYRKTNSIIRRYYSIPFSFKWSNLRLMFKKRGFQYFFLRWFRWNKPGLSQFNQFNCVKYGIYKRSYISMYIGFQMKDRYPP